ncbi:MAG: NAD-dependent epimerase [Acidimicrobiia bacterium]
MATPSSDLELEELASRFAQERVLVTGGLGFLGSNLAIVLARAGARVTVADSLLPHYGGNPANLEGYEDKIAISYTDIRDEYAMAYLVSTHDYIFNFAGQVSHRDSMADPKTDLEINASAPLSLLEAVRKHNPDATVIYAGTRQVYGRPRYLPVDEDHPLDPVDANGISNLAGELYHLLYAEVYGLRAGSFRLTNTYGPRQRLWGTTQGFVPIFVGRVLTGQPITIYGDGSQQRDFVYVDDSLEGFLRLALTEEAMGSVYNQGHPQPVSLRSFAELLVEVAGQGTIEYVPWPEDVKKIDIGDYYGSFEKAKRMLGWEPKTSLAEGLEKTIAYYRDHLEHYIPASAMVEGTSQGRPSAG